jgi:aflatoxin B1 aldehyde reductase
VINSPDTLGARVHELSQTVEIVDACQKHGHNEVDTARIYAASSSEEILSALDYKKCGIIMDIKLYPNAGSALATDEPYTHKLKMFDSASSIA